MVETRLCFFFYPERGSGQYFKSSFKNVDRVFGGGSRYGAGRTLEGYLVKSDKFSEKQIVYPPEGRFPPNALSINKLESLY